MTVKSLFLTLTDSIGNVNLKSERISKKCHHHVSNTEKRPSPIIPVKAVRTTPLHFRVSSLCSLRPLLEMKSLLTLFVVFVAFNCTLHFSRSANDFLSFGFREYFDGADVGNSAPVSISSQDRKESALHGTIRRSGASGALSNNGGASMGLFSSSSESERVHDYSSILDKKESTLGGHFTQQGKKNLHTDGSSTKKRSTPEKHSRPVINVIRIPLSSLGIHVNRPQNAPKKNRLQPPKKRENHNDLVPKSRKRAAFDPLPSDGTLRFLKEKDRLSIHDRYIADVDDIFQRVLQWDDANLLPGTVISSKPIMEWFPAWRDRLRVGCTDLRNYALCQRHAVFSWDSQSRLFKTYQIQPCSESALL